MKRYFYLFLALSLCACGTKAETTGTPATLQDKFEILYQNTLDSTLSFEDYEPLVVEVLDLLEYIVCNDPNAEMRFLARRLPIKIFLKIGDTEPANKFDSIWNLYHYQRHKILSTWYVQQLTDSAKDNPFIILSYAAPYDADGNDTRVSFTFSESSSPKVEPIMLVVLPVVTDNPLIFFTLWDENNVERSSVSYTLANHNIEVFADSVHTSIVLSGDFLKDMLSYEQINVCYFNDKIKQYDRIDDAPLEECVTRIPVGLHYFQQQYQSAHQWLIEQ